MKLQFFKPIVEPLFKTEKKLINVLIRFRTARYSVSFLNIFEEADYPNIKMLVIKLGERILKANYSGVEQYNKAKLSFGLTINELFKSNAKFILVSYASQLLQYYTLICDKKFDPKHCTAAFLDFAKDQKFGDMNGNLFVAEYKLIKIYNDLSELVDSKTDVLSKNILASQISYLLEELNAMSQWITQWVKDAPDNIFVHYLNFAFNYCFAIALELQFVCLDKSLSVFEQDSLSDIQQSFLKQAQEALKQIKKLKESENFPLGSEFSLGQDVFNRLPVTDIETMQLHIHSLINS